MEQTSQKWFGSSDVSLLVHSNNSVTFLVVTAAKLSLLELPRDVLSQYANRMKPKILPFHGVRSAI